MATSSGNVTSSWIKFFTAASIPPSDAANYAIIFTDNRILHDMLLDLNKEYLNDMGIAVMGDVIAILKHAKLVHGQEAREKALKESANPPPVTPSPRRSTPASRIVDHYLGKDPKAAPMNEPAPAGPKISKEMAERLGPSPAMGSTSGSGRSTPTLTKSAIQAKKLGEGKYKISMPRGTTMKTRKILEDQGLVEVPDVSKSSVFARLGEDSKETKFMVTGLASSSSPGSSSVFNRLGGKAVKRAATSTSQDSDEEYNIRANPLEYAGVLKSPKKSPMRSPAKKAKTITKTITTGIRPTAKASVKSVPTKKVPVRTEGIFGRDGGATKVSILKRLGKELRIASASSTTSSAPAQTKKITVSRKPAAKSSLKARLGPAPMEVTKSETKKEKSAGGSVFSRLGNRK